MDKKYLSKIVQGSNTLYIKDEEAREMLSSMEKYTEYLGVTTTAISDGAAVNPVSISGENVTAKTGSVVNYGSKEFIFNGSVWQEFGDLSGLGSLAYANTAEGSYAPAGTNAPSAVSFSDTATGSFVTGVNDDAVAPSFTEGAFNAGSLPSFEEGAFTPAKINSGFVTAGSAATYTHSGFNGGSLGAATTGSFATEGVTATYAEATETLTLGAASKSSAVTAQGTFTPAVYGTDSFNGGTPTVVDVTKFDGGSKAADTFNAGSAATPTTANAVTAVGTGEAAAQVFSGTQATITVE
jgi:hypothetical protein